MKFNILIVGNLKEPNPNRFAKFDHAKVDGMYVAVQDDMPTNLKLLSECELIVCENDWEIDKTSDKVIQIARIAGKEVIHHSRFQDYVSAKNN